MVRQTAPKAQERAPAGQKHSTPADARRARSTAIGGDFKLTAVCPKEAALQRQIIAYLRAQQARGRIVWFGRFNGGAVKVGKRWIVNYRSYLPQAEPSSAGVSDLLVLLPGGQLAALEVKRPGESATDEQIEFLNAVRNGGGIAAVVRGFEDVPSVLFGEINPWREPKAYS